VQAANALADDEHAPFMKEPFCVYKGHSADLLDVSWSKVCVCVSVALVLAFSPQANSAFHPSGILAYLATIKARCIQLRQVTLCDHIWQVTLYRSEIGFLSSYLVPFNPL